MLEIREILVFLWILCFTSIFSKRKENKQTKTTRTTKPHRHLHLIFEKVISVKRKGKVGRKDDDRM